VVTLKDVADAAGVSRSAVSRVFTHGASASEAMRQKVEKAANELGYTPNVLASSLTTGRTRLIGLVSNNFHNPIFLEVFDRFTRRAFGQAGIPVVHSFGRYTHAPHVHVVGIDNVECGRIAARELIERGYRKVAFLGGPEEATSTQDRETGFLAELRKQPDISVDVSYAQAYTFDAGRQQMLHLLESSLSEAYFCGDDVLSIGAMSALKDAGFSVPEDVGIIGLNDMEMAGWQNIALTTIRQPIEQIIDASIELIVAMLDDPDSRPEARLFPSTVIERSTLRAKS